MALERLGANLRLAARKLRAAPGFTAITVTTLALGIGANAALLGALNAVFLRPLPYPHGERLVHIWSHWPGGFGNLPFPDYEAMVARSHSFEALAAYESWGTVALTGRGSPVQLRTTLTTADYLPLLGARPILGRLFEPSEVATEGVGAVALLSYPLWMRGFGGNGAICGQSILLNGMPFTIVGVLPPGFHDIGEVEEPPSDIWLPVSVGHVLLGQASLKDQAYSIYFGLGLLKKGVTPKEAGDDIAAISRELEQEQPNTHRAQGLKLQPAADYVNAAFRRPLLLLLAGAGLILLIACVNVANALLARLAQRRREMALRSAIGARLPQLVAQLLAECGLLAALGGVGGLLFALWTTSVLGPWVQAHISTLLSLRIEPSLLLTSALLTAGTTVGLGILPALDLRRVHITEVLLEGGRSGAAGPGRLSRVLVVLETGLALALVVGCGLMLRSVQELGRSGLGFRTDHLLTFSLGLRGERYAAPGAREALSERLLEKVGALPSVESVSLWGPAMLGHATWVASVFPRERPPRGREDFVQVFRHSISPGALHALGIALVSGREFDRFDDVSHPKVAIISESVARELWPGTDPLGKELQRPDQTLPPLLVVGVAADARHRQRYALEDLAANIPLAGLGPQRDLYLPYLQRPNPDLTVAVRTSGSLSGFARTLAGAIGAIDPDLPLNSVQTLEARLAEQNRAPQALTLLLGAYAGIALLLASLGIYGVLAQSVTERTHEIGIRVALGADRGTILGMVLGEGMALALGGLASGLVAAALLSRLMASLLYDVGPRDPLVYALSIPILAVSAFLGCLVPARRATSAAETSAIACFRP